MQSVHIVFYIFTRKCLHNEITRYIRLRHIHWWIVDLIMYILFVSMNWIHTKWNMKRNNNYQIDGLMQKCSVFIANALAILQSGTKPAKSCCRLHASWMAPFASWYICSLIVVILDTDGWMYWFIVRWHMPALIENNTSRTDTTGRVAIVVCVLWCMVTIQQVE